jgi:hypothetical protein
VKKNDIKRKLTIILASIHFVRLLNLNMWLFLLVSFLLLILYLICGNLNVIKIIKTNDIYRMSSFSELIELLDLLWKLFWEAPESMFAMGM